MKIQIFNDVGMWVRDFLWCSLGAALVGFMLTNSPLRLKF